MTCPLHSKSHNAHDERIIDLEAEKKMTPRTQRIMAERIVKLEKALLKLDSMYQEKSAKLKEADILLKKWM